MLDFVQEGCCFYSILFVEFICCFISSVLQLGIFPFRHVTTLPKKKEKSHTLAHHVIFNSFDFLEESLYLHLFFVPKTLSLTCRPIMFQRKESNQFCLLLV